MSRKWRNENEGAARTRLHTFIHIYIHTRSESLSFRFIQIQPSFRNNFSIKPKTRFDLHNVCMYLFSPFNSLNLFCCCIQLPYFFLRSVYSKIEWPAFVSIYKFLVYSCSKIPKMIYFNKIKHPIITELTNYRSYQWVLP